MRRSAGQIPQALLAVAVSACIAAACRAPEPPSGEARIYRVRGMVRQLPSGPAVPLLIAHEAIPDLVDAAGRPAPMAAMTMSFETAYGLDLSTLAVGDAVALTLRVDWSAPTAMHVTGLELLPPGTQLDLRHEEPTADHSGP